MPRKQGGHFAPIAPEGWASAATEPYMPAQSKGLPFHAGRYQTRSSRGAAAEDDQKRDQDEGMRSIVRITPASITSWKCGYAPPQHVFVANEASSLPRDSSDRQFGLTVTAGARYGFPAPCGRLDHWFRPTLDPLPSLHRFQSLLAVAPICTMRPQQDTLERAPPVGTCRVGGGF